jgi:hypothetical protein
MIKDNKLSQLLKEKSKKQSSWFGKSKKSDINQEEITDKEL